MAELEAERQTKSDRSEVPPSASGDAGPTQRGDDASLPAKGGSDGATSSKPGGAGPPTSDSQGRPSLVVEQGTPTRPAPGAASPDAPRPAEPNGAQADTVAAKLDAVKAAAGENLHALGEKLDDAKAATRERLDAVKAAAGEKLDALGKQVSDAKAAAGEKVEAAKHVTEKVDKQVSEDKNLQVLKAVAVGFLTSSPEMQNVHGTADGLRQVAGKVSDLRDALSGDPAAKAAAEKRAKEDLNKLYESLYPAGFEAGRTFLNEKSKGASTREAAFSALDQGLKYVPFATAAQHLEKAEALYKRGDHAGAVREFGKAVQSWGEESVKIAVTIDGAAGLAESAAGRNAGASRAAEAPKTTEAPKTAGAEPAGGAGSGREGQPPVEIVPDSISPEELRKVTVPPDEPVPATVRTPGTGEPPVEIVPDSISPEELQKVTVPQEAPAPEGTGAAPADAATIELDRGAPQPGAAQEPHPRDLPAAGDAPRLDERQQPFGRQTVPRERGGPSAPEDLTGTDKRTGMGFHERNAAEMVNNLRVEYDPSAGRPVRLSYDVDRNALAQPSSSARGFARDWSTEGAQGTNAEYARSGYDRGHLVQREAFKGSIDTERAADLHTQVVPMAPELNRGAGSPWRAAERATVELAREYGSVRVEVEPVYANDPARLRDGTPIPDTINRRVYAPDGTLLRDQSFDNRGAAGRQPAAQEPARVRVDPSVSDGADQARIRVDQAAPEPPVDAGPLDEETIRAGQRRNSG